MNINKNVNKNLLLKESEHVFEFYHDLKWFDFGKSEWLKRKLS